MILTLISEKLMSEYLNTEQDKNLQILRNKLLSCKTDFYSSGMDFEHFRTVYGVENSIRWIAGSGFVLFIETLVFKLDTTKHEVLIYTHPGSIEFK